jgi:predicted DNA binding CopG/RHH family protein
LTRIFDLWCYRRMSQTLDARRSSAATAGPALADQVAIRIAPADLEALAARAAAEERPLAQYVRRVLRQHIADTASTEDA